MNRLRKTIIKILLLILFVITCVTLSLFVKGYNIYHNSVTLSPIPEMVSDIEKQPSYTKLDNISDNFKDAIIAAEDSRFYSHNGYDTLAIIRATLVNIKTRNYSQGGSTITQQLAKNMYLTNEKNILRKIAELFIARDLENMYSKDKILELYLNSIYYGDSYYTIKDASLGYFKSLPQNLTLDQATMLAGIPNAPSIYSPNVNLPLCLERQKHVIDRMKDENYLSTETADTLTNSVQNKINYLNSPISQIK